MELAEEEDFGNNLVQHSLSESIKGSIEDHAFSLSYDLAPRSPSPVSKLNQVTQRKTEKERQLADKRGGKGVGEEPNHTIERKSDPL